MQGWNEQKNAALTKLVLRLVVAGYVLYLMWKILEGTLNGTSPITPILSYSICALFLLGAVGCGVYSVRQFLQALNAPAETPESEDAQEATDQGSESDDILNDSPNE